VPPGAAAGVGGHDLLGYTAGAFVSGTVRFDLVKHAQRLPRRAMLPVQAKPHERDSSQPRQGDTTQQVGWASAICSNSVSGASVFTEMLGARSRRPLQVRAQDRGTLVGGDLFDQDRLTPAAAQHGSSTGCAAVLDPSDIIGEHAHQIALSTDQDQDHRQRDGPPRCASAHLQGHQPIGSGDARHGHCGTQATQQLRQPIGPLPTVQSSDDVRL
jgi:hypothetical protein